MVLIRAFGLLDASQINSWFEGLRASSSGLLFLLPIFLLSLDLFFPVPTLTICIISGYTLGAPVGFVACLLGTSIAGLLGYLISRKFGHKLLPFLLKNEKDQVQMKDAFKYHSTPMILLARALPVLSEVTACLSGITKMPFKKFILLWHLSSVPYVLIATYAGSKSSVEKPMPAILTAIGLSLFFWLSWFFISKRNKKLANLK
jgi:uncharacterized membrane protein YdjX (TVP38/TMEM64 family)